MTKGDNGTKDGAGGMTEIRQEITRAVERAFNKHARTPQTMLSVRDVADKTGLSRSTVWRLIHIGTETKGKKGLYPSYTLLEGARPLFKAADVEAMINNGCDGPRKRAPRTSTRKR